ncbi:sensor histidine kinase [Pontibacter rugosus]|uniref:histidine kinase n=1 Tax=Pontibacter rugosus TaxID=1745966 RepID=A0ABW3SLI4_9BACT
MQDIPDITTGASDNFLDQFRGGGEMGVMMRKYDWDSHPLGAPEHWPLSLKANVRLMLNSGFAMFIWWTKELYMFYNDAYIPALGKKHPSSFGSVAHQSWAEIWDQVGGIAEGILKDGQEFYAENLLLYLDRKGYSEETYWTLSYSPAFDDLGEVNGVFCACSEVTNAVVGQRRLKTLRDLSEALLQVKTLQQAGQTACDILNENVQDLPFSLIYLCNSTGTEAELVGKAGALDEQLIPLTIDLSTESPWQLKQAKETKQRLSIKLKAVQQELKASSFTGELCCKNVAVLPILKPGQDLVIGFYVSGISDKQEYNALYNEFHDILATQIATAITSVQNKQEILRQQEYLNEIFQQAPVGITMLRGPQYIVEIANPGVCEIWGRKQEDVLGRPVLEALPEAVEQVKDLLDGVLRTGTPFVAEELPITLERMGVLEKLYLNFVYHPLRDAQGFVTGIIVVAIDISEQVRARHKIEVMNNELMASNADLDNFVYSASHDLRAPISNIEGLVEELQENLPEDATSSQDYQQLFGHVQSSIDRFKRVVADLTKVAKIQREAGEDIASIKLEEVIKEVILEFDPIVAASKALFQIDVAPASAIKFSAKNVRSVVYNLISNALKYRSPDRTPIINISTRITTEYCILTVSDNGLGIRMEDVRKMFSMFKRLHDHVDGSGIGLYIVKRIVENAGGKIEVESEINKGTTFHIFFKK